MQSELKLYRIALHGCDDSTIFEMELTDEEFALAERIAAKSEETSSYGCMPTMVIELIRRADA